MRYKIYPIILLLLLFTPMVQAQVIASRAPNSNDSKRTLFIQAARVYLGTPYISGGATPTGMDCSGLVYRAAMDGLKTPIPRTVQSLSDKAQRIPDLAREPGDLLFFNTTGKISHVGIFLGGGTFIHAASDGPKTGVIISNLSETYWKNAYRYAGRILTQEGLTTPNSNASPEVASISQPAKSSSTPRLNSFPFGGKIGFRMNYSGGVLWDFMPGSNPVRGGSANAEISWVKNLSAYPGIGAGFSWDTRTESLSFPLTVSLGTETGFRFFIGTQIHLAAAASLNKTPQFPGIIGLSWNSKPVNVLSQKLRFCQSMEYSWFPNETIGTGLRFNTGLTLSCDI